MTKQIDSRRERVSKYNEISISSSPDKVKTAQKGDDADKEKRIVCDQIEEQVGILYLFRDIARDDENDWEYQQLMRMVRLMYDQLTFANALGMSLAGIRNEWVLQEDLAMDQDNVLFSYKI